MHRLKAIAASAKACHDSRLIAYSDRSGDIFIRRSRLDVRPSGFARTRWNRNLTPQVRLPSLESRPGRPFWFFPAAEPSRPTWPAPNDLWSPAANPKLSSAKRAVILRVC